MKIYTKTGDQGDTLLFGGQRVRKDHPRIEAYGTVDELNSVLGIARCEPLPTEIDELLARIQNELFALGAELATPDPPARGTALIGPGHAAALEQAIDRYEARLAPLKQFVLPAGTRAAALLHLARTVCRRAERRLISLCAATAEPIGGELIVYLNRLSDLLFVLRARSIAPPACPTFPGKSRSSDSLRGGGHGRETGVETGASGGTNPPGGPRPSVPRGPRRRPEKAPRGVRRAGKRAALPLKLFATLGYTVSAARQLDS